MASTTTKTFGEWLSEQPEDVQMWHRCDMAALNNPGHPHHPGCEESIARRRQRYLDECGIDNQDSE